MRMTAGTAAAHKLIAAFDDLPANDRQVVAVEILRRSAALETSPLGDEDFALLADEVFLDLDCREAMAELML